MSILKAYIDKDNTRELHIDQYDEQYKGRIYCCYGHLVIAKRGEKKVHHYAHVSSKDACDDCCRLMSSWHISMQRRVLPTNIEVRITKNGKMHIADIMNKDGVVIELQKTPIKKAIITARERFYQQHTKGLVWIFNCENSDIDISLQEKDIIVFKLIKGSKFWFDAKCDYRADATCKSFLDFGQQGFIEVLYCKKTRVVGRYISLQEFDMRYFNGILAPNADQRKGKLQYDVAKKCTDQEIVSIIKAK